MDPTIVNAQPKYRPPMLVDPPGFGYLLLSADVEPPTGNRPFPGSSEAKTALLGRLKSAAAELGQVDGVERATVYRTALPPPPAGSARNADHPARYDVMVLVETTSPGDLDGVQADDAYGRLRKELDSAASRVDAMAGPCVKGIAGGGQGRPGVL